MIAQGSGTPGAGLSWPPKVWSRGQKLSMVLLCCILTSAYIICIKVLSPLYCINNRHDFKGWGENQRIMLHDKT